MEHYEIVVLEEVNYRKIMVSRVCLFFENFTKLRSANGFFFRNSTYLGFKCTQFGLNRINWGHDKAHLGLKWSKEVCEMRSMEVKINISDHDIKIFWKFFETSLNLPKPSNTSQYLANTSQKVRVRNTLVYYYLFKEIRSTLHFE